MAAREGVPAGDSHWAGGRRLEHAAVPPEEITELYLGLAITDEDKSEIIGAAKAINPEIAVFQACRAPDQSITFHALQPDCTDHMA